MPERIRVHALAKLLGTTSKRILAHLTELGAEARSAQSSLDRTVAESVREALVPEGSEPGTTAPPAEAAAAPADAAEPAEPERSEATRTAVSVGTAAASGDAVSADASPETAETPSSEPTARNTGTVSAETGRSEPAVPDRPLRQSLFTSPFHAPEPPAPEPVAFEPPAVVAAPLFLPPDATAAQEMRRKLRAERQPSPAEEKAAPVEEAKPEPPATPEPSKPAEQRAEDTDTDTDDAENSWDDDQSRDDGDDSNRSRRRRRGRRGRGRGRGEQHSDQDDDAEDDQNETDSAADDDESAENESDDGDAVPEGSSRRRRRRRRRKTGEDAEPEPSEDDPPNTVVHEREPRNKRRGSGDEVQGISGSTRLEAKRQRRRDGREAGRRRPPILTESEFLARRESVDRVMVVREKTFPEHPAATVQVAVLEDNILVEHFVTSSGQASMVGNVYLGKVQNVLPSMEAAFVDIGRGRNGVLYAGEVNWEAAGLGGKERKIEQALKPGDTVLVQVSKDPVGHKGARLTTQISLAGRFLVYVPGGSSTGISRKLPDTERKRLKEILRDIVPQDAGVIIRTASEGVAEAELARDVERLQATWKTIEEQSKNGSGAPKTLYEEPDLLVKVIRDLFNEDFSKLVIEGDRSWTTVENYIRTVAPDLLTRVERHENSNVDVFGSFRIDEQLAKALDRKVWLPSGGTLVIDRTEAMTVIDVNTGKFTGAGGSNLEETVTRNNLEAAEEIVRQMRLRDIGGMIVVDFIDMVLESNRDLVLRRLTEALGRDRTRHQVSEVTSLGLVQMTRKKLGTGLVEAFSTTCEHCHGRGILVHNYPVETPAVEESSGRREGRRRRKDKTPAPAPAAPATNGNAAPAEPHNEEDAAVKRAHPVALAMAAHQAEEAASVATAEAEVAVAAAEAVQEAAESDLEVVSSTAAQTDSGTTRTADRAGSEEGTPGRSRRRARRGSRSAALRAEAAANAAEAPSSTAGEAEESGVGRSVAEANESDVASETPAVSGAAPESVVTSGAEAETAAGTESGPAAAEPADAEAAADTSADVTGDTAAGLADRTAAEGSDAGTGVGGETAAGAETARRGRRRVARTTAAPSTDSQGAVFVLSSTEQEQPTVDFTDIPAAPVEPRSRPRRRSAGRAAGAPEQPN